MKRLTAVLCLLSLSIFLAPSASANTIHGQVCQTVYNDAFTKAEKVCAEVIESSANTDWWVKFVGSIPSGYAGPYQVLFDGKMWNQRGSTICNGLLPSCGGIGNVHATEPDGTFNDNTSAAGPNQHYCTMWANFVGTVYWSATVTEPQQNFNSQAINTVPDCVV